MSTYQELQDNVLEHQFNDTKYRPSVKRWLNDAQNRIVRRTDTRTHQTTASFTTTAADATLAVPSDYARVINLRNTTDQAPLVPIELRDFDTLAASSGKPVNYVFISSEIHLFPTPDASYSLVLRYWKLPAVMVDDTDEPGIPEDWHHLLEHWALKRAFERENDTDQATYHANAWELGLQELRGELQYEGQDIDTPRQVRSMWEDTIDHSRWH